MCKNGWTDWGPVCVRRGSRSPHGEGEAEAHSMQTLPNYFGLSLLNLGDLCSTRGPLQSNICCSYFVLLSALCMISLLTDVGRGKEGRGSASTEWSGPWDNQSLLDDADGFWRRPATEISVTRCWHCCHRQQWQRSSLWQVERVLSQSLCLSSSSSCFTIQYIDQLNTDSTHVE